LLESFEFKGKHGDRTGLKEKRGTGGDTSKRLSQPGASRWSPQLPCVILGKLKKKKKKKKKTKKIDRESGRTRQEKRTQEATQSGKLKGTDIRPSMNRRKLTIQRSDLGMSRGCVGDRRVHGRKKLRKPYGGGKENMYLGITPAIIATNGTIGRNPPPENETFTRCGSKKKRREKN